MMDFPRIKRLPPYVFNIVNSLKQQARQAGEDIIDFGLGNPDGEAPPHVVDKLVEAAKKRANHRYSTSRGIEKLRQAICRWYERRHGVSLDPESEAVVTIGSKEGISHLMLACVGPGDVVLCPSPSYPIHHYSVIIAGADLHVVPLVPGEDFFARLTEAVRTTWPRPKMMLLNFPHNPTTEVCDLDFFRRIVDFAREHEILVVHDLAYADITFDGYQAPSFLQVPGAKDIGVEFFTLSKSYNMPGWRVAFCVGNPEIIGALTRLKAYFDYGIFQPIQIAAVHALNGPQDSTESIRETYRSRRDVLVHGLQRLGWDVPKPKATMFVWARIPEHLRHLGSIEFSKHVLTEGKVAVSPGIGFGEFGDEYVRFALIENEHRTRQAIRGLRRALQVPPGRTIQRVAGSLPM
jgi:alanine-synthesizing transaminase